MTTVQRNQPSKLIVRTTAPNVAAVFDNDGSAAAADFLQLESHGGLQDDRAATGTVKVGAMGCCSRVCSVILRRIRSR